MKKVIVLGSLNKDLVLYVNKMPKKGETIEAISYQKFNGGKGGNQAVAIRNTGIDTSIISAIGNDAYGSELFDNLYSRGVNVKYIFKKNTNTSIAFINVDQLGENSIVVSTGANHLLSKNDLKKSLPIFARTSILVTQLEMNPSVVLEGLKIAKKNSMQTLLTPAPAKNFDKSLLDFTDILIPNETEFKEIFKLESSTENFIKVSKKYEKVIFVITLGGKGVALAVNGKVEEFKSKKVKVVDTTSAGDSFVGGFVNYLSKNKCINESIEFGIKAASITVTRKGAQSSLPTFDEIVEMWGE